VNLSFIPFHVSALLAAHNPPTRHDLDQLCADAGGVPSSSEQAAAPAEGQGLVREGTVGAAPSAADSRAPAPANVASAAQALHRHSAQVSY